MPAMKRRLKRRSRERKYALVRKTETNRPKVPRKERGRESYWSESQKKNTVREK